MSYNKRYTRTALLASTTMLLASTISGATIAQDAAVEEETTVETITVTGSRIVRKDLTSVSPLQITSSEEIKLSGFTRIEDMMNSLPQIDAAQTAYISNGATGTASLNLRGMGSHRTLVLVNGRRLQPGGLGQAPDINQIPGSLVERAEVITGGASSTYGADAVAGVVNFIMKNDFEGLEITAGISGFQHNNDNAYIQGLMDEKGFEYPTGSSGIDGKAYTIDMTMGSDFADGKGHATVYATWRKVEELTQASRDYSSCALNARGDTCGGSGNAIVPNFYVSDGTSGGFDWGNWDYWSLDASGDGFIPSVGNQYNYAPVNHFQRPDERFTFGAFVDYEINDNFKPYMEVSFMRDRTDAQIAESGTFFAETYIIPITSDIIDEAQRTQLIDAFGIDPVTGSFATYIGKRNVEGGPRAALLTHNSFRMVAGTKGDITDSWTYDASVVYGSTQYTSTYINDFLKTAVEPAIQDGSYPVFGYQEITADSAAVMTGTGVREGITKEYVVNAYATGDLGFQLPSAENPVQAVIGVEYRKEIIRRVSDTIFQNGLLLGQGGPRKSVAGEYDVKEVFAELMVPLVEGAEFAQSLELELGGRISDYNLSGTSKTYKVGLSWQPIDEVKFTTSYNRAERAANVTEYFSEQAGGLWSGSDGCAGETPTYTAAQCANTGVTAAQYGNILASPASQYNAIYGGNLDLSPEVVDTWSVGAVITPVDNFNLRVDLWDIKLANSIGGYAPATILANCAEDGDPFFCQWVNRGAGGSLWLGSAGSPGAGGIIATNQNVPGDALHYRGLDIGADYSTEFDAGTLVARLQGSYSLKKGAAGEDGSCSGLVSSGCGPNPKWRHTMGVTWESNSFWTVKANWRYFSSLGYNVDPNPEVTNILDTGLSSYSYFDLKATFAINENAALLVGMNNIFDKEPPMVGGSVSSNANTFAGYYDTLGRYLHASVTFNF